MIRLDGVSKRYPDGTVAVHELSLDVRAGELVVLVGPSGCGKTTTMKMVNRLVEPTGGRIFVNGADVTATDTVKLRRGIGYVIQNVGLFPHRSIEENVAIVTELTGWSKSRRRKRAHELMELVGLHPGTYAKRYPHELSGGQRQRVGVARALAADPPVLLMDEPFSAVDPVVRSQLQDEFLRLQHDVRKTILFVTHDIEEAVRLGDRIAVFADAGRLEQFDTPAAVLGAPSTPFVADFVGADRGLKRLSVTPVTEVDIEQPPVVHEDDELTVAGAVMGSARWAVVLDAAGGLAGWVGHNMTDGPGVVRDRARRMDAWVALGDSLKVAFSEMLQWNAGWIAVLDETDRFLGVLTPSTLHAALRRSVEAENQDVDPSEVDLITVSDS
ncbi:ATP-binding cassette domain-containing protein [Actinobacteria bacterium YIM 96077]|uniref:ABC-type quaternary amine transporter n=1 Tax=Phytoactinopolyspora halophila TaxID=1981511 RepID=A0A329R104_9ACTN|nr:betaine/proline/choline family ABC transporter ATP-binding protein [Phytoactinopolyspora halophila]AYY15129.1 ATP-binding cassette domain-containing protein [Actinobacteria bacterium YIM 96077]RAW18053.1 ABC transporter ATP-binding protein [Phytoactinopolyspora halophila]